MVTRISFTILYGETTVDDRRVFPILREELIKLNNRINRKDFRVRNETVMDDETLPEEESVGAVVGERIVVLLDDVYEPAVMSIYQKSKERAWAY